MHCYLQRDLKGLVKNQAARFQKIYIPDFFVRSEASLKSGMLILTLKLAA